MDPAFAGFEACVYATSTIKNAKKFASWAVAAHGGEAQVWEIEIVDAEGTTIETSESGKGKDLLVHVRGAARFVKVL